MVSIYSDIESPRLTYVCDFIFGKVLCTEYELLFSVSAYQSSSHQKINYSSRSLEGIQIIPSGLLTETKVEKHDIAVSEWKNLTVFYANKGSQIPFDLFSAVFYLISRYEEYLPSKRDAHDRFLAENSILHEHGLLQKPIIDLWCQELNLLLFQTKELNRSYSYHSTIDVDNAYAYKFKSFGVKLGSTLKSIVKGTKEDLARRFGCYFRQQPDPYDTYDFIDKVHKEARLRGTYFFLLSDRNEWDRNLGYTNKHYRGLISALQRENDLGIHPGYNSYKSAENTFTEKLRLEDISGEAVVKSRQHFLRIIFPDTPDNLVRCGIKEDYSLGYAEVAGFRAGTCTPFQFFDLNENNTKDLVFHSSCLMDATLNRYMGLNPEEAIEMAQLISDQVREVNGEMITIWHNETLSELREWVGWSRVFREVVLNAADGQGE